MIEIDGLTKRYGDKTAVDGLSFVVEPGVVTGFLGPNGAGKPVTELRHSLRSELGGRVLAVLRDEPWVTDEAAQPFGSDDEQVHIPADRGHGTVADPAELSSCSLVGHGSHLLGHGVRDLLQPGALVGRDLDVVL